MTPEILARLCPKIADLGSRGGLPELTALDVAAALAGLAPGPYHLARLAWVDDHRAEPDLVRALCDEVSPPRRPGMGAGRPYLAALALAIAEYAWPPRCHECEGHGVLWTPKPKHCTGCHGSGSGRWSERQMAEAVGVSVAEWREVWRGRYERAYRCVSGWGSEVASHLHRRLGGELDG